MILKNNIKKYKLSQGFSFLKKEIEFCYDLLIKINVLVS